jgi:hypothetical protein
MLSGPVKTCFRRIDGLQYSKSVIPNHESGQVNNMAGIDANLRKAHIRLRDVESTCTCWGDISYCLALGHNRHKGGAQNRNLAVGNLANNHLKE